MPSILLSLALGASTLFTQVRGKGEFSEVSMQYPAYRSLPEAPRAAIRASEAAPTLESERVGQAWPQQALAWRDYV
jgi:hypothetical protein